MEVSCDIKIREGRGLHDRSSVEVVDLVLCSCIAYGHSVLVLLLRLAWFDQLRLRQGATDVRSPRIRLPVSRVVV